MVMSSTNSDAENMTRPWPLPRGRQPAFAMWNRCDGHVAAIPT